MSHAFSNNTNSFNVFNISNHLPVVGGRSEILTWLSPLEPSTRHQDVRVSRFDKVGDWLLQTHEFRRWCDSTHQDGSHDPALYCYGNPGVGKTYICSLVIDRLCEKARDQNFAVACFYFDYASRNKQSPANMLGSLLKQIVYGMETVPREILLAFEEQKKVIGGQGLRVSEILKMLQTVTLSKRTFICVDAMDECVENHRPDILDSLAQLLQRSPGTRLFVTGRRHVRDEVQKYLAGKATILSVKSNEDDVIGFIRARLSKDGFPDAMDGSLEAEIIKSISENMTETFLLVSLKIEAILEEPTIFRRRQRLRAVSEGLDLGGVYGATLARIEGRGAEQKRLGMAALMWISHSERPLQINELLHALSVGVGSETFNTSNIPSIRTLLSCCLGLVTVDEEASTVRLIHVTLQEYISTRPDLFDGAHSTIAETCLSYLNFQHIKDLPPTLDAAPQSSPFLQYSSLYWGAHARRGATSGVISLALNFLSQFENLLSTKLLLMEMLRMIRWYIRDIPTDGHFTGFTGLHCASLFGIVEIVATLTKKKNYKIDKRDFLGFTPLIWAAICGQEKVSKLLLEQQDLDPDKPDTHLRRTALSWAAEMGHEEVVKLLLGRTSVNSDPTSSWWGKTPRVLNLALGKKRVNANTQDIWGQTALSLAAGKGHEGVVRLLLEQRDVNPDKLDKDGHTPLALAARRGHEGVMQLLLERNDVNPNVEDDSGRTAIFYAAAKGNDAMMQLLLKRKDIDPNLEDRDGRTPLFYAAAKGHGGAVELLLVQGDVNTDRPDINGYSPLSMSALRGHEGVVKLLLGHGAKPDTPDKAGHTPLSMAANRGHEGVVALLVKRTDVNPDRKDDDGHTPLSLAAVNGYEGVVKLLLRHKDVNPESQDKLGRTPLLYAAIEGHERVAGILLALVNVSPNRRDSDGHTPLLAAARSGHGGVLKLLLRCKDINPDAQDKHGRTSLSIAASLGHEGVVALLLERGDVNPEKGDNMGRTPLLYAAAKGHEKVVELLLARKDVKPDRQDKSGRTPLSLAESYGNKRVMELLQARRPTTVRARTLPTISPHRFVPYPPPHRRHTAQPDCPPSPQP